MKNEEIVERLQDTEGVINQQAKRIEELENTKFKNQEFIIPDYTLLLSAIIDKLDEQDKNDRHTQISNRIEELKALIKKQPNSVNKQYRFLLFPETNQGQYYKIVFGRLSPWTLAFLVVTYIFIIGYKGIEIYRYDEQQLQSAHYERAWLYLRHHAKKKTLAGMDDAYDKTGDK